MEIYKPVPGYEDAYEVSNFGNVRSLPRTIYVPNNRYSIRNIKARVLKTIPDSHGYHRVTLNKKSHKVHKLVLLAFQDVNTNRFNPCDHIDGNKSNNALSNLRVTTIAVNTMNRTKKYRATYSSPHNGISYRKDTNRWIVRYNDSKKRINVGSYATHQEAVDALYQFINNLKPVIL